jgi:large subunit ribosomal protein L40
VNVGTALIATIINMLVRCRPSSSSLASSSRAVLQCRGYAAPPEREQTGDGRSDLLRKTLYPPGAPSTPSPTGVHHPQHLERLAHVVPNPAVHETITRAWALHQREVRAERERSLRAKFEAMKEAMDELENIGDRRLFELATSRKSLDGEDIGSLKGRERKWKEARIEGLFPREAWVPTETPSTKGWNYEWKRPRKGD